MGIRHFIWRLRGSLRIKWMGLMERQAGILNHEIQAAFQSTCMADPPLILINAIDSELGE